MGIGPLKRAVFLDRDGVINPSVVRDGKPYPPATVEEFRLLPRVREACEQLKSAGFLLIVVTNQPDVARGTQLQSTVEEMHALLRKWIPVDDVVACYHDGDDCDCRKPKPGMLLSSAKKHNIDLTSSYMVGDRWRDVDCGARAGCTTVFIDYGYAEALRAQPDYIVADLASAAEIIIEANVPGKVQ